MDSISLIIEAELQAQQIIEEARKKSDQIKSEVEIQGNRMIDQVRQETANQLEQHQKECDAQFQESVTRFEQEKTAYKYKLNQLLRDKKDSILNRLIALFFKDLN